MKLKASDLKAALAKHIGDEVADAISCGDTVSSDEVGALLVKAFAPGLKGDAELLEVIIAPPGEQPFAIEESDVASFPLLRDHVPATLAEALSLPFSIGLMGRDRMSWTPDWGVLQIADLRGELCGIVDFTWAASQARIHATAVFGPLRARPPFARYVEIDGNGLLLAGREARVLTFSAESGRLPKSAGKPRPASGGLLH